jgi:hypothetical protein
MMATEYAQGFAVPNKRPFRETILWRALKWTTVLSVLVAVALLVYAYKFVNHDVREQNDIDKILDEPTGAPVDVDAPLVLSS